MYHVYLSLGSNIGDRHSHLSRALEEIASIATIAEVSSIFESEPVGMLDDAGIFYNMAVGIRTSDDPPLLMVHLKKIEKKLGRKNATHLLSRIIDIDIALYRGLAYEDHTVTVPHPALQYRRFVLEPLCEIAPMAVHPVLEKTMATLLRNCHDKHSLVKLDSSIIQMSSHS